MVTEGEKRKEKRPAARRKEQMREREEGRGVACLLKQEVELRGAKKRRKDTIRMKKDILKAQQTKIDE